MLKSRVAQMTIMFTNVQRGYASLKLIQLKVHELSRSAEYFECFREIFSLLTK